MHDLTLNSVQPIACQVYALQRDWEVRPKSHNAITSGLQKPRCHGQSASPLLCLVSSLALLWWAKEIPSFQMRGMISRFMAWL